MTHLPGDNLVQVLKKYLYPLRSYTNFCTPLFGKHKKNPKRLKISNFGFFSFGTSEIHEKPHLKAKITSTGLDQLAMVAKLPEICPILYINHSLHWKPQDDDLMNTGVFVVDVFGKRRDTVLFDGESNHIKVVFSLFFF